MAEKDFKVKHGLFVTDSANINNLTVRGDASVSGSITVTGNFVGEYAGFDSDFNQKTTTNLTEGDNLYYTTARADSAFDVRLATKSTTNLAEGNNLYYTSTRADSDFDVRLVTKSTDNLTEGTSLYYTTARADSDFDVRLVTKSTDDLTEGDNLYYTTVRVDSDIDARVTKTFIDALNVDADTLDGVSSESFLRSDVADTKTSGDLTFSDNVKAVFGDESDLQVYHDGTNSYIKDAGTGHLVIQANAIGFANAANNENLAFFTQDGAVNLYYDNAQKLVTTSSGIDVTGTVTADGLTVDGNATINGVLTGDSAVLDGISFVANPGTYAGANTPGTLFWDSDEQKGLSFVTRTREGFPGATINVGQESVIYVHNQTGEAIVNGDAVYISGTAHGLHPSITKARANVAVSGTLAIATQDIANNAHGYVTRFGLVRDVNTGGLTAGANIYLSKDSDGKWTTTEVTVDDGYPLHIGKVVRNDSSTGTILVDPFTEHYEYLRIQDRLKVTGSIEGTTIMIDSAAKFAQIDYLDRPAYLEGTVWYDQDEHALAYHTADSDYINYIGEREWLRGRNSSGTTILKGTPVYTDGVHIPGHPIHGHHPLIYAADAGVDGKYEVLGLTAHDIANGSHGYVITRGWLDNINTSALTSGERFHLAVGGGITRNAPGYPNYPVDLGIALTVDSANGGGSIYINVIDHTLETLRVTGDARVDGSMTIGGNLNVVGTTTEALTQSLTVSSNFVKVLEGDTLGTTYQNTGGLDDATFKGSYTGDSDLYYFVRMTSIDSAGGAGDVIEWGISDSNQMLYGSYTGTYGYGVGFDSASGPTTWSLKTDGKTAPLRQGISIQFINAAGHDSADVWCAHPAELNLDLGIVGNYNPSGPGGLRYTGVFRDVTDARWKFFDGSTQNFSGTTVEVQDSAGVGYSLANVQANTFYGALSGNATSATSATQLATGRNFSLTGDITASAVSFDGTGNVQLTTAYNPGSIVNADISATAAIADTKLATISTAGKVQNGATTATSTNTASAIVARDASGNFSAGTISASGFTSTGDMTFADNSKAIFGGGSDLQIFHDASNSYIQSATGNFNITTANGAEFALTAVNNGAVTLFHDGNSKLATTSTGIDVTGTVTLDDTLNISGGSTTGFLQASGTSLQLGASTASNLIAYTNNTERMRIDSSGDLTVKGGRIFINESDNGNTAIGLTRDADEGYVQVYSAGAITSSIRGNGDSYFNGGNVGIGTTNPDTPLHVVKNANSSQMPIVLANENATASSTSQTVQLGFGLSRDSGTVKNDAGVIEVGKDSAWTAADTNIDSYMAFQTYTNNSSTEKMRIDSSGNVIVGGTSAQASDAATLMADGEVTAAGFYFSNNIGAAMNDTGIRRATTNTMVFDTNSTERMRIDGSGNLLVGRTTSTLGGGNGGLLQIGSASASGSGAGLTIHSGTAGLGDIQFADGTTGADSYRGLIRYDHSNNSMQVRINASEAMRIDSSGNVGIGTTAQTEKLVVDGSIASTYQATNFSLGEYRVQMDIIDSTKIARIGTVSGASTPSGDQGTLTFMVNSSEKMRIDSSGRVGIGGTPNTNWRNDIADQEVLMLGTEATLFSDAGVTTELWNNAYVDNSNVFKNISTRGASRYFQYQGAHKWFTAASANAGSNIGTEINTTPKMTLDVSGNLLVGKTVITLNTEGHAITPTYARFTRNGAAPVQFNRTTSDGDITIFYKDGATVGIIGTRAGDLTIGTGNCGVIFNDGTEIIIPANITTNAVSDANIDLGYSAGRFKDLHLSGSVVLDEAALTSQTTTTTTTSQTAIATFAAATYGSAEVLIQAKDGSNRHLTKLLITHNGTTATATEYGTVVTSSNLATYEVDINSGNVRVLATPASTNSTVFKMTLELIEV